MKIFQTLLLATSAFLCFISPSLDAANPAEAKTIGRTVREMPELSNFLQLLEKTGIGSILSENTSTKKKVNQASHRETQETLDLRLRGETGDSSAKHVQGYLPHPKTKRAVTRGAAGDQARRRETDDNPDSWPECGLN